jgi:SAM-dependent methyltransferase
VSARFQTETPHAAYDHTPFAGLPAQTWSADLFRIHELQERVVAARCHEILVALGAAPGRLGPADELASQLGVIPGRRYAFDWLLERLRASGLLSGDGLAPAPDSAQQLASWVAAEGAEVGSTFELIDLVAGHYPAFLRGEVDGARVLFNRETLELWVRYFHPDNLAYAPANDLAAHVADQATPGRDGLAVLEVGGGLGSAAAALLERLGPRTGRYLFTELAPVFLSRARRELGERFPTAPLEHARLDLDGDLAAQLGPRLDAGPFDLIYAVNTLHAVRDLVGSLRSLTRLLAPGGALVLGETTPPQRGSPVPAEMVFLITRELASIQPEPFRARGGFLHRDDWRAAFAAAGLELETVPDLDQVWASYPNYPLVALVGRRPA